MVSFPRRAELRLGPAVLEIRNKTPLSPLFFGGFLVLISEHLVICRDRGNNGLYNWLTVCLEITSFKNFK